MSLDFIDFLDMRAIVCQTRQRALDDQTLLPTNAGILALLCVQTAFGGQGVDTPLICCAINEEAYAEHPGVFALAVGRGLYDTAGEVISRQDMSDIMLYGVPASKLAGEIQPTSDRVKWFEGDGGRVRGRLATTSFIVWNDQKKKINAIVRKEISHAQTRMLEQQTPHCPVRGKARL